MWRLIQSTCTLGDPDLHVPQWEYFIRWHPRYWKTLVRRAVTLAALHIQDKAFLLRAHEDTWGIFAHHGCLPSSRSLRAPAPADATFFGCMHCRRQFRSKGGEGARLFRRHGIANGIRYYFDGTACPHCLKEYHTTGKLFNHLAHASTCRLALLARGPIGAPAPGRGSQHDQAQRRVHDGLLPEMSGFGPHLPDPRRAQEVSYDLALLDRLTPIFLDVENGADAEVLNQISTLLEEQVYSWTVFHATVQHFRATLTEQDADIVGLPLAFFDRICQLALDPSTWNFVLLEDQPEDSPADLETLEKTFLDFANYNFSDFCGQVPQVKYRERVILHAFSGRRRPGDFQFFVEHIAAQDPTVAFVVLSVDIVIDPIWGNVANPKTKAFWMDAARQGLVRAFLGGPPCETWSIARGKVVAPNSKTHSSRMPRILRTEEFLWGLWSTSLREKSQLMVGHELLLFSFQIMAVLACTCGLGVLEHPSEPSEPNAASIWKLPLAQFLLNLPCVQRVEFSQGLMGAYSRKPTTFMTLNLPDLVHLLHCHRVTSLIPTGGSIGLSEDGSFKTGGLKEYPPALCCALASVFTAAMCVTPAEADLPATFFNHCKALVATEYGTHMGQDHAG